ncbi:MAG: TfoX/Sxy family protein [Gammaproteobacteria bacterium]|nr:TfoX/Sxy family protein [Gammaproteobacteria bacterium]
MAYDQGLAQRVRKFFVEQGNVVEKKMFGGLAFMLSGHMCCGVVSDKLMARVGVEQYADALGKDYVKPMDFTGKPLKGFVYVEATGIESDADLKFWLNACVQFIGSLPAK